MHLVDDATSTVSCQFSREETIWAAVGVLRVWIERYGVPRALYTDWKNVYVRAATEAEKCDGKVPVTQFARMCGKLGIRIIAASSPQAKGRVERVHGTHQDRLVKKLRLAGVAGYDEANRDLEEHYIAAHNRRYARPAAEAADYHRRRLTARQLDQVFWLEEERVVSEDWVVRYQNRLLQLERQSQHWAPSRSECWCGRMKRARSKSTIASRACRFAKSSVLLQRGARQGALPLPPRPHPQNRVPPSLILGGNEDFRT